SDWYCSIVGSSTDYSWSLRPSRSKARRWISVGVASIGMLRALARRTVLRVKVARSASRVRKLWTGSPSAVGLALGLGLAGGEGCALATGEVRKASPTWRS